jgi:hypothetical protein
VLRSGHGTRLIKNNRNINACTDFKMLKVKVPIIRSGTRGWTLINIKLITFNIKQIIF